MPGGIAEAVYAGDVWNANAKARSKDTWRATSRRLERLTQCRLLSLVAILSKPPYYYVKSIAYPF